ncbi:hypothetical protein lerEdw1_019762 [Lerista edwardsae]|nr:hypothetical protein lerEdw1_019762 [Lerista edwardsae]
MDNFEYSIQLSDQDWAAFYLASEECNLIQPALATADEQLLSDLEEGEVEEGRLIRVRVGPALAHSSVSRLPQAAPDGHLLAEEIWSGSEDETDLGSVNRFLYKNSQLGAAQSSGTQEQWLSCDTLKPPRGQSGSATESDILRAAEGRASGRGDQSNSHSVVAIAVQKEDLQGQNPTPEMSERLASTLPTNLDTSERTDNPDGGNGSSSLCLAQQHPKDDASQRASVSHQIPTLLENTAVGRNPEFLEPRDQAGYRRSAHFSSPNSTEHQGAEHLEKGTTTHQEVTLSAQSVPCQEELPASHGHSVPAMRILAPADPLPENHADGAQGRSRKAEEGAANLRGEGKAGPSDNVSHGVLKDARQVGQVVSPNREMVRAEDNKPTPTMDDSRCSKTLDQHRDSAPLTREQEEEKSGEPRHRLGMAVPLEEESHVLAQGSQRADVFRESARCGPTWENSPESNATVVTWPEMYDCFFCDDSQEQGGKTRERAGKERPGSDTDPSLLEIDGPEMYEYFFNEVGEARGGNWDKGTTLEKNSSSGHRSAPGSGSEDPDSDLAGSEVHISVPEVYEHFFVSRTTDKRTWSGFFLSMPALEAKKFARALKSLVCKPVRPLRSRPTRQGALLRRGSQGRLVLLSCPGLLEDNQPRAGDPTMAVMNPGTAFRCYEERVQPSHFTRNSLVFLFPERPLQPLFSQSDMCLGFVAFASWAVKTSNLQSPDAWKIVIHFRWKKASFLKQHLL